MFHCKFRQNEDRGLIWYSALIHGSGLLLLFCMAHRSVMNIQIALAFLVVLAAISNAADSFPVTIRVDAGKPQGELKPIWPFFGADEPNYASMKNGRKLLAELGSLRP